MTHPITHTMTDEKLQEIYTDKKFRNQVATAHQCCDQYGKFKHKKTCSYPHDYIVTDEQIALAQKEREKSQKETQEKHKNSLLFVGMGWSEAEPKTEIGNPRIRSEFLNKHGKHFLVEFGTSNAHDGAICLFSIDKSNGEDVYNYAGLEKHRTTGCSPYTPDAIMKLVNCQFDCNFTEVFIDNHDLHCDGVICESPK